MRPSLGLTLNQPHLMKTINTVGFTFYTHGYKAVADATECVAAIGFGADNVNSYYHNAAQYRQAPIWLPITRDAFHSLMKTRP